MLTTHLCEANGIAGKEEGRGVGGAVVQLPWAAGIQGMAKHRKMSTINYFYFLRSTNLEFLLAAVIVITHPWWHQTAEDATE
jgi:hypothetical protein